MVCPFLPRTVTPKKIGVLRKMAFSKYAVKERKKARKKSKVRKKKDKIKKTDLNK